MGSRFLAAWALSALLAGGCGGEKKPAAQGIPIGFFGALSGPQATFALSGKNGAKLAADQLNRAGGVLGKQLELLVEDDHNEASEAASAVSSLITRDHVVALIGENASSRSLAAAPIAQSYQVPMVSPSSTNVAVTKKGDYIFRVCFVDSYQGKALATFARQTLKAATAALLVDAKSEYSVGLAAAPIAQNYQVPMVSPSSTNVAVTKKGDYIFRVCFVDSYQGKALATFARQSLKAATAALLVDAKSDYSVGLAEAFRQAFTGLGGRVVADLKYAEGDSDFSAQLTAIRPSRPDIIVVPGYYTDAGLIARQARGLGIGAALLGADGWDSPKLTEIGGQAVEGAYFSNHYSVEDPSPAVRAFVDEYRRVYGADPDSIAALSYDAARLIADAMRRAGSTEGKRVRDALAATKDFPGVTGRITMDADRNPVKPAVILKVQGGKFHFAESIAP